jgi:hypothetical protein
MSITDRETPDPPCQNVRVADIRAVVTDLDGTIVRSDGTISAATSRIAAALDIPLLLATARTPAGVRALPQLLPHVTVAICCNGAIGWEPATGQIHWQLAVEPAIVTAIVDCLGRTVPGAGIAAYDGDAWVMNPHYQRIRGRPPRGPGHVTDRIPDRAACAMSICHPTLDVAAISAILVDHGIDPEMLPYGDPSLLDVAPPGVDKGTGLLRALDALGVAAESVIGFGDMPNDLPMLRLIGHPIAVGNAHPEVRAAAGAIAGAVDDDGFAEFLGRTIPGLARSAQ